mmetsp:Transcript_870/g.1755  ORF Transcript_870/g.1755 Transcript_870/m.1755 type:complete len:221 (+) Transcript_870:135-797(+)
MSCTKLASGFHSGSSTRALASPPSAGREACCSHWSRRCQTVRAAAMTSGGHSSHGSHALLGGAGVAKPASRAVLACTPADFLEAATLPCERAAWPVCGASEYCELAGSVRGSGSNADEMRGRSELTSTERRKPCVQNGGASSALRSSSGADPSGSRRSGDMCCIHASNSTNCAKMPPVRSADGGLGVTGARGTASGCSSAWLPFSVRDVSFAGGMSSTSS